MRQKAPTIELVAERMDQARSVLCKGHPEREALFIERRMQFLAYAALRNIAKRTQTTPEEVARTIGLPSDKFAALRASLKDPTFLTPEEHEWYENFLMTGERIAPIRDTSDTKPV